MTNPIFEKAAEVVKILRDRGEYVEFSTHPTAYGNSAYVSLWAHGEGYRVTRGFRLSDHDVGERRRFADEVPTVIDGNDVTVATLLEKCEIEPELKARLDAEWAEKEAAKAAKEKAEREAKAAADAKRRAENKARNEYDTKMIKARKAYIAENHPEFGALTKTKQQKIIKPFNKKYRMENPE